MAEATIIMAGGSGTRLWPASLPHHPKQLLRIGPSGPDGTPYSLVQQAILRAASATPSGPIVIVTHRDHGEPIATHVDELSVRNDHPGLAERVVFLAEPVGRNTAPAIALGIRYLKDVIGNDGTALVLTADHVIEPVESFAHDAEIASSAARGGSLVTFGIPPTRPETGFGYVHVGEEQPGGASRVLGFKEKPDAETAEAYLTDGSYLWNSGMFAFSVGAFWDELRSYEPDIAEPLEAVPWDALTDPDALRSVYETLPKISIDYAVMERSESVAVVPASFGWFDVGSWDEASRLAPEPISSNAVEVESTGNFVDSDLPVALCGVDDLHVVVKNGRVLICRRGQSQLVKAAVDKASELGIDEF